MGDEPRSIGKALVRVGKLVALAVVVVTVAFFTMMFFFSPFDWRRCDESHPAVKRMRSLSQEQLGDLDLYGTLMDVRAQYEYDNLMSFRDPRIPSEFDYLKALRISFGGPSSDVDILLAKCNVSVGVRVNLSARAQTIELMWHKSDPEYLCAMGSEVLGQDASSTCL